MFDLQRFINVMNRITIEKIQTSGDSFNWQEGIISKWRTWYIQQNIDIDEAFRLADFDFDGFLSQSDIRLFLVKFLGINEKDILSAKLERLFKLLDTLKRGKIQKTDLQKILGSS